MAKKVAPPKKKAAQKPLAARKPLKPAKKPGKPKLPTLGGGLMGAGPELRV
jgi:hypothetical protein